ncbi:MAG: hypothetical protein IBX57_00770 [Gammaproteobacteria bacterium]|nr:hypothetical protein [Gammaproteobacteria bacterium]
MVNLNVPFPPFPINVDIDPQLGSIFPQVVVAYLNDIMSHAGMNSVRTYYFNTVSTNGYQNKKFIDDIIAVTQYAQFLIDVDKKNPEQAINEASQTMSLILASLLASNNPMVLRSLDSKQQHLVRTKYDEYRNISRRLGDWIKNREQLMQNQYNNYNAPQPPVDQFGRPLQPPVDQFGRPINPNYPQGNNFNQPQPNWNQPSYPNQGGYAPPPQFDQFGRPINPSYNQPNYNQAPQPNWPQQPQPNWNQPSYPNQGGYAPPPQPQPQPMNPGFIQSNNPNQPSYPNQGGRNVNGSGGHQSMPTPAALKAQMARENQGKVPQPTTVRPDRHANRAVTSSFSSMDGHSDYSGGNKTPGANHTWNQNRPQQPQPDNFHMPHNPKQPYQSEEALFNNQHMEEQQSNIFYSEDGNTAYAVKGTVDWKVSYDPNKTFDAAYRPSTHVKMLIKDLNTGNVREGIIEKCDLKELGVEMDYAQHETDFKIKSSLPLPNDGIVVPNYELLKDAVIHPVKEEGEQEIPEEKRKDVEEAKAAVVVSKTIYAMSDAHAEFLKDLYLRENKINLGKDRAVEFKTVIVEPVAVEDLDKVTEQMYQLSKSTTVTEFVSNVTKMSQSTTNTFPKDVLARIVKKATKVVNDSMRICLSTDIEIENLLEDWDSLKGSLKRRGATGEAILDLLEGRGMKAIKNIALYLLTKSEAEDFLKDIKSELVDGYKGSLMLGERTYSVKLPYFAEDLDISLEKGVGAVLEKYLPNLHKAVTAIAQRAGESKTPLVKIHTKEGVVFNLNSGWFNGEYYLLSLPSS